MEKKLPEEVRGRLQKLGVGIVTLFGSEAQGVSGPLSDIDLGVVMEDRSGLKNYHDLYIAVHDLLYPLFPERSIDLVFLDLSGLEIRRDAILYGRVLFESSEDFRLDFEEHLMLDYADFKPILDLFDRAIMERLAT